MNTYKPFIIFFDSINNPISAPVVSGGLDISALSDMSIEVKNATKINMIVEGCGCTFDSNNNELPDNECVWTPLAIVNATTFNVSQSITNNGIYLINLGGCRKIRLRVTEVTGKATVTGMGVR